MKRMKVHAHNMCLVSCVRGVVPVRVPWLANPLTHLLATSCSLNSCVWCQPDGILQADRAPACCGCLLLAAWGGQQCTLLCGVRLGRMAGHFGGLGGERSLGGSGGCTAARSTYTRRGQPLVHAIYVSRREVFHALTPINIVPCTIYTHMC